MKLLAFVLLGFLAHSCSGHVLIDQSAFSDHVCSEIRKDFAENEGTSLLGLTGILTSITNLANLDITILHQTNDLYGLEISGFVDFSSTGITGLRIDAHVLGQLSLTVTNDCLDILLVESSLQINLNVLNKAYFIGLGGGIGGLDVLDGFTSSAELLLRGIIKEVIKTGLLSCNTGFQGITKIVDYLGNSLSYHVNSIESSANALWLSLDLVIVEALGAATRTITLATYTVTELVEGVLCSIFVSAEIFEALLDYALDDVIPSIQRIIKVTEWQLYGLYQNVDGDVSVSVLKIKTPSCKITSAGGLFSLAILLQFRDHTGNQFLELAVEAEISFGVTGKTGLLGLSFSGTSITSQQISSQSDGCGCPDVNPLDILGDLSGEIIGDLVSTVNSVFAIPSLGSLVSYLPTNEQPALPCTPFDTNVFQCDSGY